MQPKTVIIPFNYGNFIKTQEIIWAYANRRFVKIYSFFALLALILLVVNLIEDQRAQTAVSLGIVYGYAFYILMGWAGFYERKVKFMKKRKDCAKRFQDQSLECTFTFSEDALEYKDNEKLFRLSWSLFTPCAVFKDTLLLIAKDSGGVMLTISRDEVGADDYNEISALFDSKIGFLKAKG